MKVLLIGKTGQLGGDLIRNNPGHELFAPDRNVLDLERPESLAAAVREGCPDLVINTAAFHNVPLCESEVERAFRVNCAAVRDLAALCRERGALFVTFSSDYVFGGDKRTPYLEDDRPHPLQMYGISRVAGEFAALATAPKQAVIIRTCGLYGRSGAQSKGGNFVDKRIEDAKNCPTLEMGCDQVVSPTSTDDLSRAVWQLVEHPGVSSGIYHLVNEGECSWYEFTRAIYEIAGLPVEVVPVDRGGMSGEMRRPLYSALANARARELGIRLPHWRDGLERYLRGENGN
ncbi:dTDP-4-dehydrorhamnose reductase [Geobacter argillaceus]|uniref:dTDP-4-dehydrorhamnose reductase n=1 Tax=Geobacter argillaceus TaxID=345631 RepID=A0A562WQX7_9BACT|nr:dTDP-4-dehydrorhamnose reductase [Geobacter argillaceus]TWJ32602.1 dTDP-4-dehydrorhamnose reductase [Geobacter argillaceus]